eukprot:8002233-Ditylum_brightwellii.AAC.1
MTKGTTVSTLTGDAHDREQTKNADKKQANVGDDNTTATMSLIHETALSGKVEKTSDSETSDSGSETDDKPAETGKKTMYLCQRPHSFNGVCLYV